MASDILVKIGADISQFSRSMAKANEDMRKFGKDTNGLAKAITSVGSTLTKAITAPALAAATALAGITVVKGFGRLVGIDTARAKLVALGHDAESVESIMNSALDSVRGTAYGLDEAATAAASAVAAGVQPGEDLTRYLSNAADAAAVAGTNFGEMGSIFGKVQTAQRAYTGELNQLADRGIPIFQWLADEAGVTADAVRDMAKDGAISSEMFFDAIDANIGGAAKVIGEQSFSAALRNIGSDIARIGANFLDAGGDAGGFFSTVKPLLTEFRGFLAGLEGNAAELGKKFGQAFVNIVNKLREMKQWYDSLPGPMQSIVKWATILGSIFLVSLGPALMLVGKGLTFMFVTLPPIIDGLRRFAPIVLRAVSGLGKLRAALVLFSGPVGWVTLGVGALVAGVIAAVKWFNRKSEETKKLNSATEELGETTDALVDSINQNSDAYENQKTNVESSAAANEKLANQIEELSKKENKSAADKSILASRIEELNGRVEGLGLAYDAEADALSMSSEELAHRLDLMKETEAGIAAQERMTEIMEEQNEAQMKLAEINDLREEWNQKLEDGKVKAKDAKDGIAELDEQEQALKETLGELGEQYTITEQQAIDAAANAAAAIEEGNLRQITSYNDLGEEQAIVFDNMKEAYDELYGAATDAFEKIETETEHTMESMLETLLHNQKAVKEWAENQASIMAWAGENGYDNLIPYVESMGIDSAAELAVLAGASESEMKKFAEAIESGAEVAGKGLKTTLGGELDDAVDIMIGFAKNSTQTLRDEIEASGFNEIGKMIPAGLIEGIDNGSKDVSRAADNMSRDMVNVTEQALGIHSPSRVYRQIGAFVTEGLGQGIEKGTSGVMRAINQMLRGMLTHTNEQLRNLRDVFNRQTQSISTSLVRQFTTMGSQAMAGLRNGMNANRSSVMATATGIANGVASTMRNALKIKSPSRIMKAIGEFIGSGLAKGISDTTRQVQAASDVLAKAATPEIPQIAGLDVGNVRGHVSAVSAKLSAEVKGAGDDDKGAGETHHHYRGMLEGAKFFVREEADIDRIATKLADKTSKAKRIKGVRTQNG